MFYVMLMSWKPGSFFVRKVTAFNYLTLTRSQVDDLVLAFKLRTQKAHERNFYLRGRPNRRPRTKVGERNNPPKSSRAKMR